MPTKLSFRVENADAGTRLDKFLAARSGLSRLLCRRAIEEGAVWEGRQRLRRLSMPVVAGQVIELNRDTAPEEALPVLRILLEDASLVAVDKPAGVPSQGTLTSDRRDALAIASRQTGRELRTVHRLDAGTSGVLLLAKNHTAPRRWRHSSAREPRARPTGPSAAAACPWRVAASTCRWGLTGAPAASASPPRARRRRPTTAYSPRAARCCSSS